LSLEDKIKGIENPYKRWAFSALMLGILIYIFPPLYGEGYHALESLLTGNPVQGLDTSLFASLLNYKWFVPIFFLFVLIFKVFAMSFTNAGGGVGGTFGPTLIVGGIAGFVLARVINLTGIHVLPENNFVLVGMAGLMAGVMQAPMTAIFLIAEITGGYELLMPLSITAAISFATIRVFEPYSIYTKRIAKSGELLTHDSDQAVLTLLRTSDLIESDFCPVHMEDSLGNLVNVVAKSRRNIFPVVDSNGKFQGFISLDDIRMVMFDRDKYDEIFVYNIMKQPPHTVCDCEKMDSVMDKFEKSGAWNLPVVDENNRYLGFVSKSKIFSSYREKLQDVSHD
jgi:CIC family chloride channel protein